jgi:hypothetical protein
MKPFIALCLCSLSVTSSGRTTLQTFTSPDGVFQFKYSPLLVRCTRERNREAGLAGSWIPAEGCLSQTGICDDSAGRATTIVCFSYPKDEFKDKPAFSGAAFFVAEVKEASMSTACFAGSPDWLIESRQATKINSISVELFRTSEAWTGGSQTGEIYRAFRGSRCYEFGVQDASTNEGAFDSGTFKHFTKRDGDKVHNTLKQAVDSFTFLK